MPATFQGKLQEKSPFDMTGIFFYKNLLTALARYDIVKMSIRLPRASGGDPGSMLGCHLIDSHFHPFRWKL